MNTEITSKLFDFVKNAISETVLEEVKLGCSNDIDGVYDNFTDEVGAKEEKHGCTKIVLFFDDIEDYVIKIPFVGRKYFPYDDDEEDYCDEDVIYFDGAGMGQNVNCPNWDYCAVEEAIYQIAVDRQIEEFFSETCLIGTIGDTPIYASQKIQCEWSSVPFEKRTSKCSKNSLEKANSMYTGDLSRDVVANMIEDYGCEKTSDLLLFIEEYSLDDFHNGNIGIAEDGTVKIIDYSCYND